MKLWVQIALTAAATGTLFAGMTLLVARGLRLPEMTARLAAMVVRFFLVVLLALGIVTSGVEHRVALVFTVGATYFAAAVIEGVRRFRRRETKGCPSG